MIVDFIWENRGAIVMALLLIMVITSILAVVISREKAKKLVYEAPVVTDWRATGQIDFISDSITMRAEGDEDPAQFMLLMQEQRQVQNIAGGAVTEIRWRYATKAEAKSVVRSNGRGGEILVAAPFGRAKSGGGV